jgi:YVTN family beta-propeller protein
MDADSGKVQARIRAGLSPFAEVASAGKVYVANYDDGTLTVIDPATNGTSTVGGFVGPNEMTVGGRDLVISDYQDNAVYLFDTIQERVVSAARGLRGLLVAPPGAIWVLDPDQDQLAKLDQTNARVLSQRKLAHSDGLAYADGALWVTAPAS